MKPPFAYFGGKTAIAERIADVLPAHGHYVEPFAGSLSVLLAKPAVRMETVNDLDGAIVNFWRVLRDRPADLARACALSPHSRAEFEAYRGGAHDEPEDDLERARQFWVVVTQARTGRLMRTGWRHYVAPSGVATPFPGYLDAYIDRMAAAAERLHRVTLECRPALHVLERFGACDEVLLYLDPPYLGSTRGDDKAYRHELMTESDHREFGEAALAAKASVVISGYASDLYDLELFPHWDRMTITTGTGQGSQGWSNRTEVLWSNRPLRRDHLFAQAVAE